MLATPGLGDGRAAADAKAADLLALRPHFRRELEQKLARAGYEAEEIAGALDKLARLRLLDDAALARTFIETTARRKGWGRMRVAQELARRGAPREAAEAALALLSAADDLEAARKAAERWRRGHRGAASSGSLGAQALARHLARKGFARNAILKVLKEMAPLASDQAEDAEAEDGSETKEPPT